MQYIFKHLQTYNNIHLKIINNENKYMPEQFPYTHNRDLCTKTLTVKEFNLVI